MSIISFYSYKGGTGRTTTLANVAVLLAQEGHNIACLDLDLTGPGLDIAFEADQGLLDKLLSDYFKGIPLRVEEMCLEYSRDIRRGAQTKGKLYIFPAPRVPEQRGKGIEPAIKGMIDSLKVVLDRIYDKLDVSHILLDARSGFARESALLFLLSDKIFVSTRFSDQHIRGTEGILSVLDAIKEARQRTGGRLLEHYTILNDVPRDLPDEVERKLQALRTQGTILIRENRMLRWRDRVVVLDNRSVDMEARKQYDELLEGYGEILKLIVR